MRLRSIEYSEFHTFKAHVNPIFILSKLIYFVLVEGNVLDFRQTLTAMMDKRIAAGTMNDIQFASL